MHPGYPHLFWKNSRVMFAFIYRESQQFTPNLDFCKKLGNVNTFPLPHPTAISGNRSLEKFQHFFMKPGLAMLEPRFTVFLSVLIVGLLEPQCR